MGIHNLSFNNKYQNDLEFLITMSDPDLVQQFLFIVYRIHYRKCIVEARNLRSKFFCRLLEKGKNVGYRVPVIISGRNIFYQKAATVFVKLFAKTKNF
jgi:hypothetical protein